MSAELEVSADLATLLELRLDDLEAQIVSALEYILPLEWGHSGQAPEGMVEAFADEYGDWYVEELEEAIASGQPLKAALEQGVIMAALRIMRAIADRTPVDTGRAKGSWDVILPDGTTFPAGPKISLEEQRRMVAARKKAAAGPAAPTAAARGRRRPT